MISKSFFSDHFLSFFIILLVIAVSIISYHRFIIKQDYVVGYEGECELATNNCFVGCDDDACTKEYYYSKIQKYAPDLFNECGKDITGCASASMCLPNDRKCSVTYCNPKIDGDLCKKSISSENTTQNIVQASTTNNNLLLVK